MGFFYGSWANGWENSDWQILNDHPLKCRGEWIRIIIKTSTENAVSEGFQFRRCRGLIRGQKVILDRDLAILYRVSIANLNKAVSRNLDRFPEDFMLQLTDEEFTNLIFHFGTSSWGGTRKLPRAFTEQGVAMLSSVLRSKPRAVSVNIEIMRAFVRLRQMLSTHANLERRLNELEKKYDAQFKVVFDVIRQLMAPKEAPKKRIGFQLKEKRAAYWARG